MSDQSTVVVQPSGAVGDGQTKETIPEVKTVPLEAHQRLLNQKKKSDEELDTLRNEKKVREEEEAKKRGDYEAILKSREEELKNTKDKLSSLTGRIVDAQKLTAVINAAGVPIDPKWHNLISTSDIVVHPETGEIDQMGVTKVVENLRKSWPEMFAKTSSAQLPADAPKGNGAGKIARAEWLKLDLKEMGKWKPDQIIDL